VRTTQQGLAEGIARGVDERGALQVQTGEGIVAVNSGEVSVRLGSNGNAR
jgi:biotin-(acetyl-CoA carboxylase) ligase